MTSKIQNLLDALITFAFVWNLTVFLIALTILIMAKGHSDLFQMPIFARFVGSACALPVTILMLKWHDQIV